MALQNKDQSGIYMCYMHNTFLFLVVTLKKINNLLGYFTVALDM